MTHDRHLVTEPWADYELLDSGEGTKLERFGSIILERPETQALWARRQPGLWKGAHATFALGGQGLPAGRQGAWRNQGEVPESWEMSRGPMRFLARFTSFKHVGVFPELESNWEWVKDRVRALKDVVRPTSDVGRTTSYIPSVLNLFGYTGIATLVTAHAGAKVTHVDAAKTALDWAHENAKLTGLAEDAVRWIPDDALAFAKREVRRLTAQAGGAKYDGIILDPPAFGRGPKGEVWHIERDLPTLLSALKELLAEVPGAFFLVNGYAAGYAPRSLAQAVESAFGAVAGESGELHIKESSSERVVPSGIYCRFVRE
jgi:23S rRNA (cytosine1962-C5)-methyltransferase